MNAKKDWELNRLKALKEEEERRLELEEDEMLYTYSRDDAYQQVKKRNKQLVLAHRRAAAAAKADALSPVRKSNRLSIGSTVDSDPELIDTSSVDSTPKLITGKGRGRKKLQITPKTTPKSVGKLAKSPGKVGKVAKANAEKSKPAKKLKGKIKTTDSCDNGEEIDVETVGKDDEIIKQPKKPKKKNQSDKPVEKSPKKAKKRSPKVVLTQINTSTSKLLTPSSTEATLLQSLPGFSSSNPIDIDASSPSKLVPDSVRANIFEKLSPVKQTPEKQKIFHGHDRGNIFEQFNQNLLQSRAAGANIIPSPISSSNIRFINTQHGRQMVVVSASNPVQQSPQNLVLVQGMQGLPQGLILNNLLPLQGAAINMATLTGGATPVGLSSARVQSPRIVSPQFTPQIQTQPNPAFVQRLVSVQQSPVTGNLPHISGLSLGSVQQLTGLTIPRPASQIVSNIGQINTQQLRLPTPSVQSVSAVNIQSPQQTTRLISPRKSPSHTIADLIEARNVAKSAVSKPEKTTSIHYPAKPVTQSPSATTNLIPNLGNIMKAQVPVSSKPSADSEGKVRVNPTVAQLVASHINAAASQPDGGLQKMNKPAIITTSSTSRAASPTIVKLVAASSLRAGSPVSKSQVTPVSNKPGLVEALKPKPATPQPSKPAPQPSKTESPVATINIKGLPPGVTIPASLVNSLVSGSIGGISKTNLNVLRGVLPAGTPSQLVNPKPPGNPSQPVTPKPQAIKPVPTANININASPEVGREKVVGEIKPTVIKPSLTAETKPSVFPTPAIKTIGSPLTTIPKPNLDLISNSSPTLQAWSNPNLVIRTRRASVQQQNVPAVAPNSPQPVQPKVPQQVAKVAEIKIATQASQPTINQINVVHVNHTNDEQIAIGKKKPEQTLVNIEVPQSNGSLDS